MQAGGTRHFVNTQPSGIMFKSDTVAEVMTVYDLPGHSTKIAVAMLTMNPASLRDW